MRHHDQVTAVRPGATDAPPRIGPPFVVAMRPGRLFVHRIPVAGSRPLRVEAEGLPAGLSIDSETGIVSGSTTRRGRHRVSVTARNPAGEGRATVTLTVGDRLALTPPMGWNSFNRFGCEIDEVKVRTAAEALVASGLADRGFAYVNIDDGWQGGRDRRGRLRPHDGFSDMRRLTDDLHAVGLRVGIYSSPGPRTCCDFEGSRGHEVEDAATLAAWGIDYLKHDWCGMRSLVPAPDRAAWIAPYRLMSDALAGTSRDIVHAICQYGLDDVWRWGARAGGQLWRTTGDIDDSWPTVEAIGFGQAGLERWAGPGHWNDPDMLVVGVVGWGTANARPTRLTPDEQRTHISLWALLAAPLLLGCDLTMLDGPTLELLTNEEVLTIDQDPLGRQAARAMVEGSAEAWLRPLAGGGWALGLFNRADGPRSVGVEWESIGLPGAVRTRDVWANSHLGVVDGGYQALVPPHGSILLRLDPA
jgi:alpha-galactosidase